MLYVAADRPKQAARSLRRMVDEADRAAGTARGLEGAARLRPRQGEDGTLLPADLAESLRVTDIVIDSLKDVAVDLIKGDVGRRVSVQIGETIARGIEVCVLHHQRKAQEGGPKPKTPADVYGSRWLAAGMGSVLMLWGEPGDLVVELRHLKQNAPLIE